MPVDTARNVRYITREGESTPCTTLVTVKWKRDDYLLVHCRFNVLMRHIIFKTLQTASLKPSRNFTLFKPHFKTYPNQFFLKKPSKLNFNKKYKLLKIKIRS